MDVLEIILNIIKNLLKMKKIFIYIAALFFISACTNNEVEIKYQLNTEIDGIDLVENLTNPYDNILFFPAGKVDPDYNVRTRQVIYDNDGNIVHQDSILSESFYDKVKFKCTLEPGIYSVITIVDIVYNKQDFCWTFQDFKKLSTANLTIGDKVPTSYGILAFHKDLINITNQSQSIKITPEHLGALYVINFSNVDYSKIKYIYYRYDLNPDTYQLTTNTYTLNGSFISTYKWDNLGKYTGWFGYAYLLPNSNLELKFTTYNTSNVALGSYSIPLTVVAGNHKIVELNMTKLTSSITPLYQIQSNSNILNVSQDKSNLRNKMIYTVQETK